MSSSMSASEYTKTVKEKLRERVAAHRAAAASGESGPAFEEPKAAEPKAKKVTDEFFTDEAVDPAEDSDGVRLSTLVPSWEAGLTNDPIVFVRDRSAYTDEQAAMIPAVDPTYRPNQHSLAMLAYCLEYVDSPTWLSGDPSVGKTSVVRYLCALLNRPFYRVNFNGHTSTEDVLGTQKLVQAEGGGTITEWHDGTIPTAMRTPYAVALLDEPSAGTAEVQMSLQAALEPNGVLMLTSKPGSVAERTVKQATGFRWVMADNTTGQGDFTGKFVGTSPQNSAWLDRVGTFIKVDWLRASDETAMLRGLFPSITDNLAKKVVQVAGLVRQSVREGNLSTVLSMRVTQAWCAHAVNLRDPSKAFEIAYLNRLDDPSERDAVLEVYRNVFGR